MDQTKLRGLISAQTFGFLRYFFLFSLILSGLFFAQKNNLIVDLTDRLSHLPAGTTIIYLPLILLSAVSLIFFLIGLIHDLIRFLLKPAATKFIPQKKDWPLIIQLIVGLILLSVSIYYLSPEWSKAITQSQTTIGQRLGIMEEPVPIAGTGSMYPTFPKGESKDPKTQSQELVATPGMLPYPDGFQIFGYRFFGGYQIGRGDIVAFANDKTRSATKQKYGEEAGLVKRVIGLPGDTIELRDGIVYVNNSPQKEPYVAKAHSTFGGDFLSDCKPLQIPLGKLFVMGDNRTASNDSRFDVGLIGYGDIDHVLPYKNQLGIVDKLWHDPKNDLSEAAKIKVDRTQFLNLVNKERQKKGAQALTYNSKLDLSSQKRGEKMLQYDDFTLEGTKSKYQLSNALTDAGYSNIVYGEFYVQGYYEASDLVENLAEFPKTIEFLAKKDYQEIGFSEVTGLVNNCPSHVVVFHLGGYVPPNYKAADIEGWKKSLANLSRIKPGWEELKNSGEFYTQNKAEIDRLNDLINGSIGSIQSIVTTMESNKWLDQNQKSFAENQDKTFAEINSLIEKLNQRSKDFNG